jgi:hypothetical protein
VEPSGERLTLQGTAPTPREAEKLRTRLLADANSYRAARTRASLGYLLARWLPQHDIDETTRKTYGTLIRKHIEPALGSMSLVSTDLCPYHQDRHQTLQSRHAPSSGLAPRGRLQPRTRRHHRHPRYKLPGQGESVLAEVGPQAQLIWYKYPVAEPDASCDPPPVLTVEVSRIGREPVRRFPKLRSSSMLARDVQIGMILRSDLTKSCHAPRATDVNLLICCV